MGEIMNNTIVRICKALGDENRLHIVQMLTSGEQCACKLLEALHISQPTLSHHMSILTGSGLVSVRKEGKWSHYSLRLETIQAFKTFAASFDTTQQRGIAVC